MSGFIDPNADSLIDLNEFLQNSKRMGALPVDKKELESLFFNLDRKKKGLIDKNEAFIEISKLLAKKGRSHFNI